VEIVRKNMEESRMSGSFPTIECFTKACDPKNSLHIEKKLDGNMEKDELLEHVADFLDSKNNLKGGKGK